MYGNPYGNYFPAQPMNQLDQLRAMQQPQQPPQMAMPAPTPPPQNGAITWVQGEEGAKAYLVAAGNSVLLMDSEAQTFYLKSTDPSGMPLPLRIFDYAERTAHPKAEPAQTPAADYVTREEFARFTAKLEKLTTELGVSEEEK